jgi:predicted membrane-bound spermidine synthase
MTDTQPSKLRPFDAAALVFVCSAAVLMLEILAGRILAPYVGISLETYTSIIGVVLAGIAVGAWAGGKLADRVDPHRTIGPVIAAGGLLAFLTVPIIRGVASQTAGNVGASALMLAFLAFFLPAVVLSAVTPMVVKLQLHDLSATGVTVGWLSGISTTGALVGTFVTGFVLVATIPTRTIINLIGAVLVVLGVALTVFLSRRDTALSLGILAVAGGALALGAATSEPCQVESAYYCMRVEHDQINENGRILWLDDLRHSYVDLSDPTHLEFQYTRGFADAIDTAFPVAQAVDALHVGGGGFTLPRWIAATRPDSRSTVLEIDPEVLELAKDELGLRTSRSLRVDIGDARLGIREQADDSRDLVVGDAFGSQSVPWHLTTREFVAEIDRVLRPGGIYLQNVIDYPTFRFARAQLATLGERFEHLAAIAERSSFDGDAGGNVVLVASHRPLDLEELVLRARRRGQDVLHGKDLDRFVGDAPVITDDFAPVDQWLREDTADG